MALKGFQKRGKRRKITGEEEKVEKGGAHYQPRGKPFYDFIFISGDRAKCKIQAKIVLHLVYQSPSFGVAETTAEPKNKAAQNRTNQTEPE